MYSGNPHADQQDDSHSYHHIRIQMLLTKIQEIPDYLNKPTLFDNMILVIRGEVVDWPGRDTCDESYTAKQDELSKKGLTREKHLQIGYLEYFARTMVGKFTPQGIEEDSFLKNFYERLRIFIIDLKSNNAEIISSRYNLLLLISIFLEVKYEFREEETSAPDQTSQMKQTS